MSSTKRWILVALLIVVLSLAGTVGVAGVTAVRHGSIHVEVEPAGPGGDRFDIAVPAALVELAIALVPLGLIVDQVAPGEFAELEQFGPLLRELPRQIDRLPDGVFVEVDGPGEHVRVEKKNDRIFIQVETDQESVRVAVPVSTVSRALRKARQLI